MRGASFLLCSLLAVSSSGCLVETPEGPAAPPMPVRLADTAECLGVYPDGTSVDCEQDMREPFPNDPLPELWVCNQRWTSAWGTEVRLLHGVLDESRYLALSGPGTDDPRAGFVGISSGPGDVSSLYELGPGVFEIPAAWTDISVWFVETQVESSGSDALVHANLELRTTTYEGSPWFVWAFPDADVTYTFSTMMGFRGEESVSYAPADLNLTGGDFELRLRANPTLYGGEIGGPVVGLNMLERVVSGEC